MRELIEVKVIKMAAGRIVFMAMTSLAIIIAGKGREFLSDPVGIAYLILWNVWWAVTFLGRRQGIETRHDKGQRALVIAASVVSVPWLILVPPWEYSRFVGPMTRGGILAYAGLVLFALGILIQSIAMFQLRGAYTVRLGVAPMQRLVTYGLYRHIRHPGYLSYIMSLTGIAIAMGSLLTVVLVFLVILFLARRISSEEKMLEEEFGEEYIEYMKSTKRLIPFIY